MRRNASITTFPFTLWMDLSQQQQLWDSKLQNSAHLYGKILGAE